MNPPPPHNILSPATISFMIALTMFMQGSLIGISAFVIRSYKGVREAAIAAMTISAGFLVIALGGPPDRLKAGLVNFLIVCGYFLIYLAISRFTKQPPSRALVFGLFPACGLALILFAVLGLSLSSLLYVRLLAGLVFLSGAAWKLLRVDHHRFRLSAHLTAIPLLIYAVILFGQMVAGLFSRAEVLPGPSFSEIFTGLSLFILSYIWTAGFILMVNQRLQSALNDLAMNDALTRVRNRRAMDQLLVYEMERVHEEVRNFSIILLDIDHFKHINDTYGHATGDLVLQWFAATLQNNLRIQDVVARWGGEEFLILLPDTSLKEANRIGERLRALVASEKVAVPQETIRITFSAGVSTSTTHRDVKHLCRVADQALYLAKRSRNRIVTQDEIPTAQQDPQASRASTRPSYGATLN